MSPLFESVALYSEKKLRERGEDVVLFILIATWDHLPMWLSLCEESLLEAELKMEVIVPPGWYVDLLGLSEEVEKDVEGMLESCLR